MARCEFRVQWVREGWAAPASKVFGTEASLERHLKRLGANVDRSGKRLPPARWCVEERPVGVWSELEGMRNGLTPARRARPPLEVRPLPEQVEVERYDPLPECRARVLDALAQEPVLSLNKLRQMVPVRFETVRAAADSLVDDGVVTVADGPRRARLYQLASRAEDVA